MADFRSIEIDFDVHKRIEFERTDFSETPNAVLRRLLKIEVEIPRGAVGATRKTRPWAGKGVVLPHGAEVRMQYNGRVHHGLIDDGAWLVEGNSFNSPSAAAGGVARTKDGKRTSLDGWLYWHVIHPDDSSWVRLADLRPSKVKRTSPDAQIEKANAMNEPIECVAIENSSFTDLTELPTENVVIAELEEFLGQQSRAVTPSEAYKALAVSFGLSSEQQNRLMPNTGENHWENRVRQARRKLVNAGKIDLDQPRGYWASKRWQSFG